MYGRPPLFTSVNTPALVVGNVTVNILPAFALDFRYRLYGLWATLDQTVAAATQTLGVFVDNAPALAIVRCPLNWGGTPGFHIEFPFPGIVLAENSALRFDIASTAAGGLARVGAFYYLDSI